MPVPPETQQLIEQALPLVKQKSDHLLPAGKRIQICNSFGPTFRDRDSYKRAGSNFNVLNTIGDKARQWLSWLSARKVQPVWEMEVIKYKLFVPFFEDDDAEAIVLSSETPFKYRGILYKDFMNKLLATTQEVLTNKIDQSEAGEVNGFADLVIGNVFGYDLAEGFPGNAWDAVNAAKIALSESLYYWQYSIKDTDRVIEYNEPYKEAPAGAAIKAYAGVYEGIKWKEQFDPQRSLEFWEWWLTEAIPLTWELAKLR